VVRQILLDSVKKSLKSMHSDVMSHRQNAAEQYMTLARSCSQGGEYNIWNRLLWWKRAEFAEKSAAAVIMADGWVTCRTDGADIDLTGAQTVAGECHVRRKQERRDSW